MGGYQSSRRPDEKELESFYKEKQLDLQLKEKELELKRKEYGMFLQHKENLERISHSNQRQKEKEVHTKETAANEQARQMEAIFIVKGISENAPVRNVQEAAYANFVLYPMLSGKKVDKDVLKVVADKVPCGPPAGIKEYFQEVIQDTFKDEEDTTEITTFRENC